MPVDQALIAAMESAVAAQPDSAALRRHLASLLLDAGRPAEALAQCQTLLVTLPDDPEALSLAARAAGAGGDHERSGAYARLAALAGGATLTDHAAPTSPTNEGGVPAVDPKSVPGAQDAHGQGDVLPIRVLDGGDGDAEAHDVEIPTVRLADVGGMENVKRRLDVAFLSPMRNPQLREMYGKSLRGGLLLFGPPGCGKTFIARATAGELTARFIAVGLSDVLDMFFGQSERNLHELFQTARRKAPCVLFIDEVDALGQKRTQARNQPMWRSVVAQLLNEMDSVSADNEGVFILGATNAPWDVDPALRRPGRFDRMILVLPPDTPARKAILAYHLRGRPTANDIDLDAVAERTDGYSGADLAHACESAAEFALEESLSTGSPRPINAKDLQRALGEVRPSTAAWFQTARNFAMFANEGGVYDDLLGYMKSHRLA